MAVAYIIPNITYCQGMNCIGAALLQIIKNEEACFYMFVGIIQK